MRINKAIHKKGHRAQGPYKNDLGLKTMRLTPCALRHAPYAMRLEPYE